MRFASTFGLRLRVLFFVAASNFISHTALAAVRDPATANELVETTVRYATEPSTGSMVLAAIVVVAVVRRSRPPIGFEPRR
ncbi:MAG: hypothetical protein QF570_01960 [Myxococcota bacterium]|jgi:hypothetical protein|nr:hypothetical protein [Myxococcota bacterium]